MVGYDFGILEVAKGPRIYQVRIVLFMMFIRERDSFADPISIRHFTRITQWRNNLDPVPSHRHIEGANLRYGFADKGGGHSNVQASL